MLLPERASSSRRLNGILLGAAVLLYLTAGVFSASWRHLWHDELYTYYISTAPSWPRFWQGLKLDLNPPLLYLLARAATYLFGSNEFAIRLPSLLAFLAGSLCLYRFTARRLNEAYALLAMLVVWASPFFYFATEARPYALLVGFLGLTFLAWDRATRTRPGVPAAVTLAMAVSGMMLSHMMAILYVVPFCLAELTRTCWRRKLAAPIWLALLLPCTLPFIYLRSMSRFEISSFPPVFQASLHRALDSYFQSFRLEAVPLLVALVIALAFAKPGAGTPSQRSRLDLTDGALVIGFLALPFLVSVALLRVHGAYFDRYAIGVVFGWALSFVFLLARQESLSRPSPIVASCLLLAFVTAFNFGPGLKRSVWARRGAEKPFDKGRALDQVSPELPLVAASGLTFLEMDHYAEPATVARLYYLTDRQSAIRYASATIFEGMPAVKQSFPIRARVEAYSHFVREHPAFLVLGTLDYPEDWLLRALLDAKATLLYAGSFRGLYKDTELYRVTMRNGE